MAWVAFSYIFKGVQIISSGYIAYSVSKDPAATIANKIMATLQIAFSGAQIGCLAIRNISWVSPGFRLGASIATGALDVTQTGVRIYSSISEKGEKWTNIDSVKAIAQGVGILCFRVSDVAEAARGLSFYTNHLESCERLLKIAETTRNLAMGTSGLISIHSSVIVQQLLTKRKVEKKICKQNSKEIAAIVPLRIGTAASAREIFRERDSKEEAEIKTTASTPSKQDLSDVEDLLRFEERLGDLSRIPDFIADDPLLAIYRCPIAKWPIRFAFLPKLSDEQLSKNRSLAKLAYDKVEAEKWIKERPREAPPGWPVSLLPLPMKSGYFVTNLYKQDAIDSTLKIIIKELRKDCLEAAAKESLSSSSSSSSSSNSMVRDVAQRYNLKRHGV